MFMLAFAAASPCFADAGTMNLEDMIQRSEFIVTGKISRIKSVDNVKLAEIEVVRTLKGNPSVKQLYYFASPTWACDVSGAEVGEEGLYFLPKRDEHLSKPSKGHLRFLGKAYNFTQGAAIYLLEHSGRGRFKPKYIDGKGYLYVHKYSDVVFPSTIEVVQYPDPEKPNLGLVRLDDVFSYISKQVAGNAHHDKSFHQTWDSVFDIVHPLSLLVRFHLPPLDSDARGLPFYFSDVSKTSSFPIQPFRLK